jgi:hypothetical protein
MSKIYSDGPWIKNNKHSTYSGSGNVRAILGGPFSQETICLFPDGGERNEDNADLLSESRNLLNALIGAKRIIDSSEGFAGDETTFNTLNEIDRLIKKLG